MQGGLILVAPIGVYVSLSGLRLSNYERPTYIHADAIIAGRSIVSAVTAFRLFDQAIV